MRGILKCEKCGLEVGEDVLHLVKGLIFCPECFKRYEQEKGARPKRGTVCVIDDDYFMKSYFEKFLEGFSITHEPRIPKDVSKLGDFDVLIVNGSGIGNGVYKNGVEFLKAYKKRGKNRGIIHLSGWIDRKDEDELMSKGIVKLHLFDIHLYSSVHSLWFSQCIVDYVACFCQIAH